MPVGFSKGGIPPRFIAKIFATGYHGCIHCSFPGFPSVLFRSQSAVEHSFTSKGRRSLEDFARVRRLALVEINQPR